MIPNLLFYKDMQLFAVMILGFLIVKAGIVKSEDSLVLSKLSIYIFLPATIISAFNIELTDEVRNGFIIALCASVGVHLFLLLFDLLYKKLGKAGAVERASVIYSNSAVFIVPIISYTLGAEWVVYSSPFIMVQLVFLWTHGARLFSSDEKFNLKKILSNVNLIAVFLGLIMLLCGIRLPAFASEIADSLGTMIGNAGMILAGMTMAGIKLGNIVKNKKLYVVTFIRLIVIPLAVLMLFRLALIWMPMENAEKLMLIPFLATITPAASTVMQLAQIHNEDAELAVAVNVATSILSIVTMPAFVWLYFL